MDVYKTHGAFSWSELATPDPTAAVAFYGALFGWKTDTMNMGQGDYHVVKVGDTAVGGVMAPPPGQPMPPAWGVYVTVDDVNATVAQATELGAKVFVPPMAVPGVGTMAVMADPQGAVFSVMQYQAPAG
jgi:predicted enzyme related to lactoylglutathione lyase